ncbi:hypothetical protein BD626DRAFT_548463 [Schizophyllum amplum]|uniref:ADF-H domain-containing protein n=1 Tax=Schizophyllum amplum TaxID=97359 RepID=A0A550CCS1_9AGAR|nr:hypothetical protein BD626DRAFT_548463 [Auriculariopsis ampla]
MGNAAIVIKINKAQLTMEEVETFDNISIEELAEELPENSPRFVVISYELHHKDGRNMGMLTLHASSFLDFQNVADVSKVIEIRDGPEGLTQEAIDSKLA